MKQISELQIILSDFLDWNKPRIICLVQTIHALLRVRTVNLTQIAEGFQSVHNSQPASTRSHSKSGLTLRGARYREGLSQKELSKRTGISQENISKMENGQRVVGEKVAKKLAKVLRIDFELLTDTA